MSSVLPTVATLADLARVDGKAELIGGMVVPLMPTGFHPGRIGGRIFRSLDDHAQRTGHGVALPDNVGFAVPELTSGRESFSPDASLFVGRLPDDEMDFIEGSPTLAVEVRSKGDYGDAAEEAMAAKRADYFEAGTAVVWDVDPIAACIRVFRTTTPDLPEVFVTGQTADAEPAVPGWRVAVDEILASS
ncbi:MAG TPA: Uma2 family endonuclease [Gemmataceae bacterium]|jgi:Uma2 family endonuclease|nr:Uma2 family endonuclease [Gemmataceae bacterium]